MGLHHTWICAPVALRLAKTLWSFGHSECNRVKLILGLCDLYNSWSSDLSHCLALSLFHRLILYLMEKVHSNTVTDLISLLGYLDLYFTGQ